MVYSSSAGASTGTVLAGYPELASSFGIPWHMTQLGRLSLLTVGDPLHEAGGATTLIHRKKKGYRIVSMRDERLVGYLSLDIKQPDGLAIKRIVDEELPIRDIASALLTGEFNARQYFAQHHARTVHRIAVTGKLALPDTSRPPLQTTAETETRRITEPLLRTPSFSDRDDVDPLQKRVEQSTRLRGALTARESSSSHAPLSKARQDILTVLLEHGRPMKSKEIALPLGKRDETIRKMLHSMKVSGLIEETEQGYRALAPGKGRARRPESRHEVERKHPQNITPFQRPLPRLKRGARASNSHIEQVEERRLTSASNTQPLVLEQG